MIRPSQVINSITGEPYLHRWYLIPRNRWFNIYLHHFLRSDDDRALHDHPWPSLSFLLCGRLWEIYERFACGCDSCRKSPLLHGRPIRWMVPTYRPAEFTHRLVLYEGRTAWTLFITGPRIRQWGFWCGGHWKHWRLYTRDGGCGETD